MDNETFELSSREKLGHRLSMAAGAIIFAAIIATSGTFSWSSFKREMNQQASLLRETATVFGAAISTALNDGDRREVQQALTSISKLESFRYAEVIDREGNRFAEMGFNALLKDRSRELQGTETGGLLNSDDLWVSQEVVYAGQPVGTVRLLADISDIRKNFYVNLAYNVLASMLLALAATMLSRLVIKRITGPIYRLSRLMNELGRSSNYGERVPEEARGEIGLLARSFNRMLADIETRNRQLIEYQETLEQRVEERTHDLKLAKDEADRANAAKSDFLATMSHEIRTPMNSMLVMSELLASSGLNPRHQRYAEIIAKSGSSLLAIINDILDLSKIQAGKLELEQVPVSVRSVIDDTLSLFYKPASAKGLDLSADIAANVPDMIDADPTRLKQVLTNLLNNALKFTEWGSVQVRVHGENGKEGAAIRFEVTDTGIGISTKNQARIFESFSQADQTTTRRFGGTGLGLAICRRLVDAMGGTFALDSAEGKGSTFHFTLPVAALRTETGQPGETAGQLLLVYPKLPGRDVLAGAFRRTGFKVVLLDPDKAGQVDISACTHVVSTPSILADLAAKRGANTRFVAIGVLEDALLEKLIMAQDVADCVLLPVTTYSVMDLAGRLASGNELGRAWYESTAEEAAMPLFAGARVLLVDDNAVNREVATIALAKFGIEPEIAHDGREAIEAAVNNRFDLIFMDCSMPEMDGFEATRRIRESEAGKGTGFVPIVALTAHIADNIRNRADEAGMNAIIVKPFTMDELANCLHSWLDETPRAEESQQEASPKLKASGSAADSSEDPVFDAAMLANLRDIAGENYDDVLRQLRQLYCDTAPDTFNRLSEAVEADRRSEIGPLAHALKSMSFNIGAGRMGKACQMLESCALATGATGREAGEFRKLLAGIEAEYRLVMADLEACRASREGTEHEMAADLPAAASAQH